MKNFLVYKDKWPAVKKILDDAGTRYSVSSEDETRVLVSSPATKKELSAVVKLAALNGDGYPPKIYPMDILSDIDLALKYRDKLGVTAFIVADDDEDEFENIGF